MRYTRQGKLSKFCFCKKKFFVKTARYKSTSWKKEWNNNYILHIRYLKLHKVTPLDKTTINFQKFSYIVHEF